MKGQATLTRLAPALALLALTGGRAQPQIEPPAWDQFRGPNGSGVAPASRPPVKLDPARPAWKTAIPPGLSSPVLSGGRIFLTAVDKGRLITLAFDRRTGAPVWRREAPETPLEKVHQTSSPASSTPCVDARRLYVYFGSYGLLCYDHDGRELWQRPIPTPRSLYGMATSPILHGDRLILVLDDDANLEDSELSRSRVIALDRTTGELDWETARPFQRSGWSTPTIWSHAEGKDLVVLGNGRLCGYDPETGAEKWFVTGFSRETIARPVTGGGKVYASASMLGGVADEQPEPEPFWEAVLRFDANGDSRLERAEMTGHFTFPLRPELPADHPGFGIPLPSSREQRQKRLDGMFASMDGDKDGFWTREEFTAGMSFNRGKPLLLAVRPGGRGDVGESRVAWRLHRNIPEIPSPLFHQGRIYMVRNGGILAAIDAERGGALYRRRLGVSGQYSASPVLAGGHLYLAANRGLISVVKAGDAFEKVHEADLGDPIHVTPAFDETTIYLRSQSHLWAFRSPGDPSQP